MKRFIVFANVSYYPAGGWLDFESDHDTLEEAEASRADAHARYKGFSQIVDTSAGKIIRTQYEDNQPEDE